MRKLKPENKRDYQKQAMDAMSLYIGEAYCILEDYTNYTDKEIHVKLDDFYEFAHESIHRNFNLYGGKTALMMVKIDLEASMEETRITYKD